MWSEWTQRNPAETMIPIGGETLSGYSAPWLRAVCNWGTPLALHESSYHPPVRVQFLLQISGLLRHLQLGVNPPWHVPRTVLLHCELHSLWFLGWIRDSCLAYIPGCYRKQAECLDYGFLSSDTSLPFESRPEDGGIRFFLNIGILLQEYTVSQRRGPQHECAPLWKPEQVYTVRITGFFYFVHRPVF
jgi:hypothetical protein